VWCPSRTRSAEGDGLCGFSFELVAVSMLAMSSPRDRGLLPPHGEQSVERRFRVGSLDTLEVRCASSRTDPNELWGGRTVNGTGTKDDPRTPNDGERVPRTDVFSGLGEQERRVLLEWVGENMPGLRRSAYGQRILYWTLLVGFIVGLAAYTGGYSLKSSVTTEPLGFVGDLLYTLGWALWTGVVVVLFLEVFPKVKRRQYKELLDAYEAALRDKARAEGDEASGNS
jgi:hypothetical protein